MYTVAFTQTADSVIFTRLVLFGNILGQLCIWVCFYKTYHALPMPISPELHEMFSEALAIRASNEINHNGCMALPPVCYRCRIQQTSRVGHCGHTNKCLVNFDHFCLFLWSPIHSTNYFFFFVYLVSMFVTMPMFMYTLILYIQYCVRLQKEESMFVTAESSSSSSSLLLKDHEDEHTPAPSMVIRCAVMYLLWVVLMWLFVTSLLVYHSQSISRGQTSRDRAKQKFYSTAVKSVSPSWRSFCYNFWTLSEDALRNSRCSVHHSISISNNSEEDIMLLGSKDV
jgi:hypothetical protein